MSLVTVQKPVKMPFSIDELAKSSRVSSLEQAKHVGSIYAKFQRIVNFQQENTPVKLQATVQPMTSTPISLPLANSSIERQLKRKRENDSIYSADSSLESSGTKSTNSLSSISDDTTEIQDKPSKKARCMFTSKQITELEQCFLTNRFLPIEDRPMLAKRLKLSQQQVKTWFQNRRMKEKRLQKLGTTTEWQKMAQGTQFVSKTAQFPHEAGCQPLTLPGFLNFQHQYPGSPSTQIYDPMSLMYGYGLMSPVLYPEYSRPVYNGLSPQPLDQHRM
ncbi:homeobox protein vent1-like [Mytilus edulis]|uniref:BARHL n=1 Tax=Mytilus edulis TaxID=6550 RepID=A0A8S3T5X9_MYTED|nr:BARHL [Mytilus edulis]